MKKQIKLIILSFVLALALAGCGDKEKETVNQGNGSNSGAALTKGEWIGMLGEHFGYNDPFADTAVYSDVSSGNAYYQQIQACSEWGVITEQGTFEPGGEATWEYALQTAVRAVGIERITGAGLSVSEDTLVDFFGSNIANIGSVDLDSAITGEDAVMVLEYARNYMYGLAPVERYEYTYNEGVYEAGPEDLAFRGDGVTAVVNNGASYKTGDVIYLVPTDVSTASAIKVTGVSGNEITYMGAEMEDVYSELQISGSYEGTIISVESADVDLTQASLTRPGNGMLYCGGANQQYAMSSLAHAGNRQEVVKTGASINGNSAHFDLALGSKGEFSIDISSIKVNADIDYGVFKGLKKAEATITFNDKIVVKAEEHLSKSIPLGNVTVNLGSTPCNVQFSLVLNIGFDGEVSLTYTSSVVGYIGYKKDAGLSHSVDNNNPSLDFHAEATVTVEPTLKVDLRIFGGKIIDPKSIANLKVTTGVVAVAKVDVDMLGDQPACIDIYLYVPLRWAVNEDGCIMTNISSKLKHSATVWDSSNSKITKRFHWEDGVDVGECTRGEEEKVETPTVDAEGQPYDEYKFFDFEELDFGIISLAAIQITLEEGESINIGINSVPGGYQASNLVYTVEDSSVCSVSGGKVTAIKNGSTTVKVSTPDGKYNTYFTVTVNGGYNDVSGFESL